MKVALSDMKVRKLRPPEKGQKSYWDTALTGFGVRVSQGGAKTFVVLDPRSKTRAQETIGRYPTISLSDARDEARRRLAEQTLGKFRPRSVTWDAARDEYLEQIRLTRKPRTHHDYTRTLNVHFKFKTTRLFDLTPHDIQKRLDKLKHVPSEQAHAFAVCRSFLNWAHGKHYLGEHPMARMKPPTLSKSRSRILTDEELKKVWRATGDDIYGKIVKLLILTGQREGEIVRITPGMIGTDRITLPAWLAKNSREHSLPKLPEAARLLRGSNCEVDEPIFGVLVGDDRKPFSAWSKNKKKLDERCGVSDWTLHDLRRTFASGLAAQGVPITTVEKLLNHVSGSFAGIVGVYQRYDFFPEMKNALEKWEAHVTALTAGEDQESVFERDQAA